ncbi:lipopolysaccharide biosynthesis protein [Nocardia arthritidis]|uniref:Oligosaccharide flippase family protein n=1 Tax=Nocardia arthritidis TaxID=228602 RepID=A0A6G9YFH9_9NOCA|nr:oligosaccharide flippase family protein [Nocardia arthritidis]QIS11948.1 oligosaccharide flippase family protein [Nocardia arthritidis]
MADHEYHPPVAHGAHRRTDSARGRNGGGAHQRHGLLAIIRDIGYVMFGKYGQYVITIVTVPLIARTLGASGLGLLAIGMSSYFIGSLMVDLGITSFLAARVHDTGEPGDHRQLNQLRGNYFAIRATTLGVMGIALLGSYAVGAPVQLEMILLGLFSGGFWSISEDWLLIGQGRFGTSTAYQGIGRIVYLALLVAFLPRLPSPQVAVLCLLVSSVPTVALTWWDSFRTFGRPARPAGLRSVFRTGAPVLASRLLVTVYGQGAAAVYSAVLNPAALGLYSAGDRLVRAIQSTLDPIGFALLPRMARRSTEDGFWRKSLQALIACVCLATAATAVVWAVAPLLIHLIFGAQFTGAIGLLRVEIFMLPATTVTSFVTTAILPVRQDTVGVLIGAIIGTCVAAVALGIAFRTHSVWTLVYGSVFTECTVATWYLVRVRRLIVRERTVPFTGAPAIVLMREEGAA